MSSTRRDPLAEMPSALAICVGCGNDALLPGRELCIECDAEQLGATNGSEPTAAAVHTGLRLLTPADLAQLPPPRYLVRELVRESGFNVAFGPAGIGKTFLVLDIALCIASGTDFFDHQAERGLVVYVAAEGASGLHQRISAWLEARDVPPEAIADGLRVVGEPVNFYAGETGPLLDAIAALDRAPSLLVVDTLARCMLGGEENSARDVGLFIDHLDEVRRRHDSAVLVVHHTGKGGELERGSSALRAAADTMVSLRPDGAAMKLGCEKQKDGPEFRPLRLVLEDDGLSPTLAVGTGGETMAPTELQLLEEVSAAFGTDWVSGSKLRDATGLARTSYYRALQSLIGRGFIEVEAPSRTRKDYRITPDGEAALSQESQ